MNFRLAYYERRMGCELALLTLVQEAVLDPRAVIRQ